MRQVGVAALTGGKLIKSRVVCDTRASAHMLKLINAAKKKPIDVFQRAASLQQRMFHSQ